jgi:hypothetical protein
VWANALPTIPRRPAIKIFSDFWIDISGLAFPFQQFYAILASCNESRLGWRSKRHTSCSSAENSFAPRTAVCCRARGKVGALLTFLSRFQHTWSANPDAIFQKKCRGPEAKHAYWILDTVEMKTAWHSIAL